MKVQADELHPAFATQQELKILDAIKLKHFRFNLLGDGYTRTFETYKGPGARRGQKGAHFALYKPDVDVSQSLKNSKEELIKGLKVVLDEIGFKADGVLNGDYLFINKEGDTLVVKPWTSMWFFKKVKVEVQAQKLPQVFVKHRGAIHYEQLSKPSPSRGLSVKARSETQ